jgi:hypothetical protein
VHGPRSKTTSLFSHQDISLTAAPPLQTWQGSFSAFQAIWDHHAIVHSRMISKATTSGSTGLGGIHLWGPEKNWSGARNTIQVRAPNMGTWLVDAFLSQYHAHLRSHFRSSRVHIPGKLTPTPSLDETICTPAGASTASGDVNQRTLLSSANREPWRHCPGSQGPQAVGDLPATLTSLNAPLVPTDWEHKPN